MADKLFSQADLDAAVKEARAGNGAAVEAARADERAKFAKIMGSEHYAGREALASKLIEKGMSADDAIELLAVSPKAAAPVQKAGTQEANATAEKALQLLATENPDVQPDANAGTKAAALSADEQRTADAIASAKAFNAARKAAATR